MDNELRKMLVKAGHTKYEVDSIAHATRMLGRTMLYFAYRENRAKQLRFLIENDIMTNDEWILHLDSRWRGMFLDEKVN